jgi:hypothetical protein
VGRRILAIVEAICHFEALAFRREESAGRCRQAADSSAFAPLRVGMTNLEWRRLLARGRGARATLEADHDRFRFQPHTPDFLDTLLDLIFQAENFGGRGPATVHDSESMFAGDARPPESIPAGES